MYVCVYIYTQLLSYNQFSFEILLCHFPATLKSSRVLSGVTILFWYLYCGGTPSVVPIGSTRRSEFKAPWSPGEPLARSAPAQPASAASAGAANGEEGGARQSACSRVTAPLQQTCGEKEKQKYSDSRLRRIQTSCGVTQN